MKKADGARKVFATHRERSASCEKAVKRVILALAVTLAFGAAPVLALTAGDVAIIGANSDNPVKVTWVALVDIPANTSITFTDNGWRASGGFRTDEGSVEWTHSALVTAGTVVYMDVLQGADHTTSIGALTRNGIFDLSTSGDQVLAFEGKWDAAPADGGDSRWLFAFSLTGFSDASDANTSALPEALAVARLSTGDTDNAFFATPSAAGTRGVLLALFTDAVNYTKSNTAVGHPSYTFLVQAEGETPVALPVFTVTPSPVATATELETVAFTVAATVTNVAVEVTCLTEIPYGASYTYDGAMGEGIFTWPTMRGDAGEYSLVFSAPASDGTPQTHTVAFAVKAALPEGAVVLFDDDFAYATGGSMGTPSSSAWKETALPKQYTAATGIYDAGGAIKFGTTSLGGSLATTNLRVKAGILTVLVDATGYDADEQEFIITLGGRPYTNNCASVRADGVFDTIRLEIPVAVGGFYPVTLSTADGKRILIDKIVILQVMAEAVDEPEFSFTPTPPASVMEMDPISFGVAASVNGNPTNVILSTALPGGATYSYSVAENVGSFNWTPALGQAGDYSFTFTAPGADGANYATLIPITVTVLPLGAPANLGATNVTFNSFRLSWEAVPGAYDYVVSVWRGSAATNSPAADLEEFTDSLPGKAPCAPEGWDFSRLGSSYANGSLKFEETGSVVVSKVYPAPVTELSFYLKGNSTATTNHSIFRVYGSLGGAEEADWIEIARYDSYLGGTEAGPVNIVTSGEHVNKVAYLEAAGGCRRFKFAYDKTQGNVAFDNVAAVYEGAGTKFLRGWHETAVPSDAKAVTIANASPGTYYYVLVGARNAADRLDARTQVATIEAPVQTVIMLR